MLFSLLHWPSFLYSTELPVFFPHCSATELMSPPLPDVPTCCVSFSSAPSALQNTSNHALWHSTIGPMSLASLLYQTTRSAAKAVLCIFKMWYSHVPTTFSSTQEEIYKKDADLDNEWTFFFLRVKVNTCILSLCNVCIWVNSHWV